MSSSSARARIVLLQGDITREPVDAIVNAANERLAGGGGVDGAIHRAAGPGLIEECARVHPLGCPTGEVRVTGAHALPARYVFHAVGPVWCGGTSGERELLRACFSRSIELAAALGVRSIAFPAISAGAYGFPLDEAARAAIEALSVALARAPSVGAARVVLFHADALRAFESALDGVERERNTPRPRS